MEKAGVDKKVFLAVTLCAAIFLLWQNYFLKPYSDRRQLWQQQQSQQQQIPNQAVVAPRQENKQNLSSAETATPATIRLGTDAYAVTIATRGGSVQDISLADYRGRKTDNLRTLIGGSEQIELRTPAQQWDYLGSVDYKIENKTSDRLVLVHDDDAAFIRRTYDVKPSIFSVDQDIFIHFKKQPFPNYMFVGLRAQKQIPKEHSENERRFLYFNKRAEGQKHWTLGDIDAVQEDLGEGNWLAVSSRYFLNGLIDRRPSEKPQFQVRPLENGEISASLIYKVTGSDLQIPVRLYFGPKDMEILRLAGNNLDAAVDFGWFTIIAYPLLKCLKWLYRYVHNYGIAIILLTVLVKLLTYPLTYKSMKSMKEMQRIQPQLARLREKYKDDKELLNREMLQLMRSNGYNPMSGCLPIFIQMPVFMALYNVLYNAIDLYGQPFFGWIHDLSAKDPFYVTPVLLGVMMFLQQKMTPSTATDPAQQRMMMLMPVIFGFMMLWLPSGLTLYMLVNSVVSILQQVWINRAFGLTTRPGASAAA